MLKKNFKQVRRFVADSQLAGFAGGVWSGMSATDYVFDPARSQVRLRAVNPYKLDAEALRADVRRAESQFARQARFIVREIESI